jgi:DNA-directed RNA polymerase subunit omega
VIIVIHPSIDKLLTKVGSKYLLVNIVSKRVAEIEENGFYQMKESEYKSSKPIGRVLEEIAKDLIQVKEEN